MKCKNCHKEFESKKTNQKFCSKECRTSYWNHNKSKNKYQKVCLTCNKPFSTDSKNKNYCSVECRKNRPIFNKICLNCKKPYTTPFVNQTFCSAECKRINKIKYAQQTTADAPVIKTNRFKDLWVSILNKFKK